MHDGLSYEDRQLVWQTALAVGHKPSLYQVRENIAVHIAAGPDKSRYWNPLDPSRQDFFEVLEWLVSADHLAIHMLGDIAPCTPEDSVAFPSTVCRVLTQKAAEVYHRQQFAKEK